jgi:hypothetical protein
MQNSAKQIKSVLPFKVGAVLDIAGKVQKVVKRDGQFKLVIEPGDVPGFVVFADFISDAEIVRDSKIRKGSSVSVRGKFQSYGAAAVCCLDNGVHFILIFWSRPRSLNSVVRHFALLKQRLVGRNFSQRSAF